MKERVFFKFVTALRFGVAPPGLKWVSAHRERAGTKIVKNAGMTATKPHLSIYKTDSLRESFIKLFVK